MDDTWVDIVLTWDFAKCVVLLLASVALAIAGLGGGKFARRFAIAVIASIVAGFLVGFVVLMIVLLTLGRAEWSGIAALFIGVLSGAATALITLVAATVWLLVKHGNEPSRPAPRLLYFLPAVALTALAAYSFTLTLPGTWSDKALAKIVVRGVDYEYDGAPSRILLNRGQESVPTLINSLQRVSPDQYGEVESGLNSGVTDALILLGRIGGPQAVEELRRWLKSDAAPDIKAAAANALGTAGDTPSANDIALLLSDRSYNWRKHHPQIITALGQLKAVNEVEAIRQALEIAPEEAATATAIFLITNGTAALASIDTPEAWAVVKDLRTCNNSAYRERVDETLRNLGRQSPK